MSLASDTLKIALFTNTYTPAQDTDATYSALTGEVATGNGYTAGGVALAGVTVNTDASNHRMKLTATNPSWTVTGVITFRTVVLYDSTIATNNLICYWNFASDQTTGGSGTFTLQFDSTNGVLDLT